MKAVKMVVGWLFLTLLGLVLLVHFSIGLNFSSKDLLKSRLLYTEGVIKAVAQRDELGDMIFDQDMRVTVQGDKEIGPGAIVSGVLLQNLRLVDWHVTGNYGYLSFVYLLEGAPHLIVLEVRGIVGLNKEGVFEGAINVNDLVDYLSKEPFSYSVLVQYVYPDIDFSRDKYEAYLTGLLSKKNFPGTELKFTLGDFGDRTLTVRGLEEKLRDKIVWFDSGEMLTYSFLIK